MKMPLEPIENELFAPCGMNCMVCYRHCHPKKPCGGCLTSDTGKPDHCRKCKIRDCLRGKGCSYCYECVEYPCKQLKSLEKSYQTRYGVSLLANSQFVKEKGLTAFMEQQKENFRCPACGGVVSLHDAQCSECQRKST